MMNILDRHCCLLLCRSSRSLSLKYVVVPWISSCVVGVHQHYFEVCTAEILFFLRRSGRAPIRLILHVHLINLNQNNNIIKKSSSIFSFVIDS